MNDELQPGTGSPDSGGKEPSENLLALNPAIGDSLQLQDASVSNQAPGLRYYVKLIGFLNKAGIIVSHPIVSPPVVSLPVGEETLLPVEDGKNFRVRGFSGRKTYEFTSCVLSSSTIPYPHLHLTFPKQVESMTMHGALRINPKSLSGWIEQEAADAGVSKIPMVIVDISTSGARVHSRRKFGGIGDQAKVLLRLPIDDEDHVFSIAAVIRKSYTEMLPEITNGGEVTTYGLEFIQPEGNVRMALQNYIYKTMAQS